MLGSQEFIEQSKQIVRDYAIEHMDKTDTQPPFDVFVVWYSKSLQNHKALLSTTLPDGMYYEITYKEAYLDAYKKFENRVVMKGVG